MRVNDKLIDQKFVYVSKHNFFKFTKKEIENKNFFLNKISFMKKKISVPDIFNDTNLELNEFLETVLDHCVYSSMKNIKDLVGKKKLVLKPQGECKLKYINYVPQNSLTLKEFTKSFEKSKIAKKQVNIKEKNSKKLKDNINIYFYWKNVDYPIIAKIEFDSNTSGKIVANLTRTKDKCDGKISLKNTNNGEWSLSCPDNKKRKFQFRKKMTSSGTLTILKDNTINALGKDLRGNKVKFISEDIYE